MNSSMKSIIEGLLFVYGEEGISLLEIQNVLEDKRPVDIQEVILELEKSYKASEDCAFSIQKFGKNKYRLQTKPELHEYLAKLEATKSISRLSPSCVEVLSIITYKGPISKNSIDEIREADSSYQFYKLRDKKLIKAVGKSETGANLYSITDNFFKLFNIQGGMESIPQIDLFHSTVNNEEKLNITFDSEDEKMNQKNSEVEIVDDEDFENFVGDENF
ncbi:SMC-Scp complex subunit ScpB [Mesoplasma corruscae]|uniref:Chromosome condensation and segregation factor B n=1 Tax=Mesoplasma corruscae TaxID=216874 RepID=A0A2S5RHP6_9MOLU|nr:SMC-Scp complex subunit ScpB [Mesoplasma corruscae]PPE06787.1 chromosome condensation and segregation factor B [Mesoplasma corruscae]